jgi:RNA polymerase sigma-70 factor (ECF subfamily)
VTRPEQPSTESAAKHAELIAAFTTATQSGDLDRLIKMLTDDVRVFVDGGGKVRAAPEVIQGADRAAQLMIGATRKHPGSWWRDDFTMRFAIVNGLPGLVVDSPEGPVQTVAFEFDGGRVRALYVMRNPEKLRHLAEA